MAIELKFGDGTTFTTQGVEMEVGVQEFGGLEQKHEKLTLEEFGKALAKEAGVENGTVFLDCVGFRWIKRK